MIVVVFHVYGQSTLGKKGVACSPCPKGTYSNSGGHCTPCPANTYADVEGLAACKQQPAEGSNCGRDQDGNCSYYTGGSSTAKKSCVQKAAGAKCQASGYCESNKLRYQGGPRIFPHGDCTCQQKGKNCSIDFSNKHIVDVWTKDHCKDNIYHWYLRRNAGQHNAISGSTSMNSDSYVLNDWARFSGINLEAEYYGGWGHLPKPHFNSCLGNRCGGCSGVTDVSPYPHNGRWGHWRWTWSDRYPKKTDGGNYTFRWGGGMPHYR